MTEQPSFAIRLWAKVKGEVSADTLEGFRRAGSTVYELLDVSETHRLKHSAANQDPWHVQPNHQIMLLATWNAFFLQTIGDRLLTADYEADTRTIGFLPPVTAEQALRVYGPVEFWISTARQAEANPAFAISRILPDELPLWVEVEPCPVAHLSAMLAVAEVAKLHTEAAIQVFGNQQALERQSDVARLRQILAAADSAYDYARSLMSPSMTSETHETVESHVKRSLDNFYLLGQLLAMPTLIGMTPTLAGSVARTEEPVRTTKVSLPGEIGFDRWILTDRRSLKRWQNDRTAQAAIASLWNTDPNPSKTVAIQHQIDLAIEAGDVRLTELGNYYCCPWAPIYVAVRSITIDGTRLRAKEQFTFDVSSEDMAETGEFRREILVATFQPSTEIDYCLPGQEHE